MTASRFVVFSALVVLLGAITLTEGLRITPRRCCFNFLERPLQIKQVTDYTVTSQQCTNEAVMFKTKGGRQLCARLSDSWVKDHMKIIDGRRLGGQGTL